MAKSPQKNIGMIIFGVGVIALLVGVLTDIYSTTVGVLAALAIWIVGMPIVKLVMGGSKEGKEADKPVAIATPAPEEPKPAEPAPVPMAVPEEPEATEPMPEEPKVEEIPHEEPPIEEQKPE